MSEEMRDATDEAQKYLEMVRKHEEAGSNLYRVYDEIASNKGLYLRAYTNLYANKGALTPGIRAIFGRKPIQRKKFVSVLKDKIVSIYANRNELITRLLAETCELCGKETKVEGHHIRKLKDLKKRWKGRREKPEWVTRMIAIHRKSLFVCEECHKNIHNGTYDGRKLTQA